MKKLLLFICGMSLVLNFAFSQIAGEQGNSFKTDSLLLLAEELKTSGEVSAALSVLHKAENHINKNQGTETAIYAEVLSALGECHLEQKNFKKADELFSDAHEILLSLNDKKAPLYIHLLLNLGKVKLKSKQSTAAEQFFYEGLKLADFQSVEYLNFLELLSKTICNSGRYEESKKYFFKLRDVTEAKFGSEHPRHLKSLKELARLYMLNFEYKESELLYLELKNKWDKSGIENLSYARVLIGFGILYQKSGRPKESKVMFEKAMEIAEKMLKPTDYALTDFMYQLAISYSQLNYFEKAEAMAWKIKEIEAEESKLTGIKKGRISLMLGNIHSRTGRYESAEGFFREGLDLMQKNPNLPANKATMLEGLGRAVRRQGRLKEAEELFLQACEIRNVKGRNSGPGYIGTIWELAQVNAELGDEADAKRYFDQGLKLTKANFLSATSYFSQRDLSFLQANDNQRIASFYAYAAAHPLDTGFSKHTFENALFFKGFFLEENAALQKVINKATPEIQKQYRKWRGLHRRIARLSARPRQAGKELDVLKDRVNLLEKELKTKIEGFGNSKKTASWVSVRNSLKEGELAIEFIDYEDFLKEDGDVYYSAVILGKGYAAPIFVPLFSEKKLGRLSRTRHLYAPGKDGLENFIWSPLAPYLKDVKAIYFSPSGLLHRINMGAVPINDSETLADKFSLHDVGSTGQLLDSSKKKNELYTDAIVFGGIRYETLEKNTARSEKTESITDKNNPILTRSEFEQLPDEFRAYRTEDWQYLEWSEKEADEIELLLESSGVRTDLKKEYTATEEFFKSIGEHQKSPFILHLATHGYFFPDPDLSASTGFQASEDPLIRSGLILAGANSGWKGEVTGTEGEDGILTAYEISQMDLSNTELVVLSACETGLGDIEGSEGVYGLQRAFKLAGVKYILMSLWSVKDKKTYEFMTDFYKTMLRNKNIPEAYRQTQNRMRKKYALPFNPRNWAGFILVE